MCCGVHITTIYKIILLLFITEEERREWAWQRYNVIDNSTFILINIFKSLCLNLCQRRHWNVQVPVPASTSTAALVCRYWHRANPGKWLTTSGNLYVPFAVEMVGEQPSCWLKVKGDQRHLAQQFSKIGKARRNQNDCASCVCRGGGGHICLCPVIVTVPSSLMKVAHNATMVSTEFNFVYDSHEHTRKADMDVTCRSGNILSNVSTDWRTRGRKRLWLDLTFKIPAFSWRY
jgi:hypothetical protein